MDPISIVYGALAGAMFALLGYLKQRPLPEGEEFDIMKAAPTIVLGAIIGGMLAVAGTPVSEENVLVQVGVYGFATVVIEYFIKAVLRTIRK